MHDRHGWQVKKESKCVSTASVSMVYWVEAPMPSPPRVRGVIGALLLTSGKREYDVWP